MSTKAEEAMSLAIAAGFEVAREFDVTGPGNYYLEGGYKVIELRRARGPMRVHGTDRLTLRTDAPKLLSAVLIFGDGRSFASKTCNSIPALTRALSDPRNGNRACKAIAAHLANA